MGIERPGVLGYLDYKKVQATQTFNVRLQEQISAATHVFMNVMARSGLAISPSLTYSVFKIMREHSNGQDSSGFIPDEYIRYRTSSTAVNEGADLFSRIYQLNGPLNDPDYPNPVPFIAPDRLFLLDELPV